MGNIIDLNFGIRILPLLSANGFVKRVDEQVQVRETSCLSDGKLFLKADEPQVGQRHEDMKRE